MNTLGMFVKQPTPGKVKTRLAARLGEQEAASLYAGFVHELVDRFRSIGDRRFLCHSPSDDSAIDYFRETAGPDFELWPQPDATLGDRLAAFFDYGFSSGAQRVVVIGSDSPTLPRIFLDDAFELLETRDTVVGPASDGGYYLIGQRESCRPIFDRIDWSGPRVLLQTVERIFACNATFGLLPVWYDVDSADDLQFLEGHRAAQRLADGLPLSQHSNP